MKIIHKRDQKPETEETIRDKQIEGAILKLRDQLLESGVRGDELLIAVCKVYSNAVLIGMQNRGVIPKPKGK